MDKINAKSNKIPEMICIIFLFLDGSTDDGAEDGADFMSVYKKKI